MVSISYIKFLENSKNILNENAKDDSRIQDIIKKANNDKSKEETLAKTMAKLITTADKAKNRYEAALKILGKDHNVTKIFANRAKELNPDMDIEVEDIQPTKSPEKTVVFDKMTERANNSWITRTLFSKINKFTKDYKVRDFFVGKPAKTREGRNIMSRSGLKWVEPMYIDFNINGKEYTICLDVVSDEGGRPSKYIIVPYESNKCFYQNHSIYDVYNSKEIAEIIINTLKNKANINEKQEDSNGIGLSAKIQNYVDSYMSPRFQKNMARELKELNKYIKPEDIDAAFEIFIKSPNDAIAKTQIFNLFKGKVEYPDINANDIVETFKFYKIKRKFNQKEKVNESDQDNLISKKIERLYKFQF